MAASPTLEPRASAQQLAWTFERRKQQGELMEQRWADPEKKACLRKAISDGNRRKRGNRKSIRQLAEEVGVSASTLYLRWENDPSCPQKPTNGFFTEGYAARLKTYLARVMSPESRGSRVKKSWAKESPRRQQVAAKHREKLLKLYPDLEIPICELGHGKTQAMSHVRAFPTGDRNDPQRIHVLHTFACGRGRARHIVRVGPNGERLNKLPGRDHYEFVEKKTGRHIETKVSPRYSEQKRELMKHRHATLAESVKMAALRPANWWDWPLDWRIVGDALLSTDNYMSNQELGKRLDASRLVKCPYGPSWEEVLSSKKDKRHSGAFNFISDIRGRVGRPGKTSR